METLSIIFVSETFFLILSINDDDCLDAKLFKLDEVLCAFELDESNWDWLVFLDAGDDFWRLVTAVVFDDDDDEAAAASEVFETVLSTIHFNIDDPVRSVCSVAVDDASEALLFLMFFAWTASWHRLSVIV